MADARRLDGIPLRPAAAKVPIDRRNHAARKLLLERILSEFQEMPGTSLTVRQANKLFGTPSDVTIRILNRLVQDGLLRLTLDGRYRRPSAA